MFDLQQLRSNCEARDIPIISRSTESFLKMMLEKTKPAVCLEIWWAVGYSGIYMAGIINKRGGKLYSREISYPGYWEGRYNAIASQVYNLISYPCDVLQVPIEKFLPSTHVDFIFIDGQKAQYGSYLAKIENIISDRTVIIIDDVIKYHHKLSLLYWYLQKKQINCVRPQKEGEKRASFGCENHTGDFWRRKHKAKKDEVISDFKNSRVYEVVKLDEDDWVMIIGGK